MDAVVVNSLLLIPAYLISKYTLTRDNFSAVQKALRDARAQASESTVDLDVYESKAPI